MNDDRRYQIIIIGGGPAGLTAGIYTARAGLKTLLLEMMASGGKIINSELVENYPGFPQGISGFDLGQLMEQQAAKNGVTIEMTQVTDIELAGEEKIVKTSHGDYFAEALIIAGGSEYAKLGIPGEEEFVGRGLSYCATCDGPFFRDLAVAVVGGGNVAISDALFLARRCPRVFVIHRRDQLRASKVLRDRAFADPKIEFIWNTVVEAISGENSVSNLQLRHVHTGEKSTLQVSGVFMAVGSKPNTEYLSKFLQLGPGGLIPVNSQMETEIPGVFAAGDIREGSIRQVVAATGDGAIAALSAERYLTQR
ncbi:MAG: thioredoxin-disulfide reductase [Dehalococcoidia bacterium]|nr:thioredoxin-disulfide reductase [Dehalococcoidia bacterium]